MNPLQTPWGPCKVWAHSGCDWGAPGRRSAGDREVTPLVPLYSADSRWGLNRLRKVPRPPIRGGRSEPTGQVRARRAVVGARWQVSWPQAAVFIPERSSIVGGHQSPMGLSWTAGGRGQRPPEGVLGLPASWPWALRKRLSTGHGTPGTRPSGNVGPFSSCTVLGAHCPHEEGCVGSLLRA